jgi:sugar/nucleoside kinase (ribokinase family)
VNATRFVRDPKRTTFDVICAGEPRWHLVSAPERLAEADMRFRWGILHTARLLARAGIRVGLATVLDDDAFGRTWLQRAAAAGIDVGGVTLATRGASLVVVDAAGGQSAVLSETSAERALDVPSEWSAQVLLLSGVSPVTSTAASLCKAARRARREGSMVVLDLSASLHLWVGRDPRIIAMLLRETDVARCSFTDLAVLGMDVATVRKAMRRSAVLVIHDTDRVIAAGAFGEVRCVVAKGDSSRAEAMGDACTAAICAGVARPYANVESPEGRWHRILQRWASR